MTQEELSLKNFASWLISAQSEDKFFYRHKIYDTVKIFGKDKVLGEIQKQSYNFKNIIEAVQLTRLLKEMK